MLSYKIAHMARVFDTRTDIASQKLRAPRNVTQVRNAEAEKL
jgi:hypothetical protein